ncbi:MAG: ribonuclease P protein component [Ruminiclostridium sp.]|nr:ribonuclease P protein component [Ruminiclostridium sp.]
MGEFSKRFYVIKKDREFRYLYKKGVCCPSYGFVCYYRPSNRRRNRCGIVTGKKIGNAVTRNRSRRVIREAFRIFDNELLKATDKRFDFIFVAREKTVTLKSTQILGTMRVKLMPLLTGTQDKKPESGGRRPAGDRKQKE